jgi:thioredoxin-dependent peroxiredoxin
MSEPKQKAPAFRAKASTGGELSLDDYRGKYLVLYFYPAAFTPGCTVETKAFRDAYDEIRELGADVLGVSNDSLETQCRFADELGAKFPILADEGSVIARAYGVVYPLIGRAKRVTFVIDPEGSIVARFHHELFFTKHVGDALKVLKGAKAARG